MKIYNTLTREKEEFRPLKKGRVGMYVCGPTVYDEPHIGHARAAYIFSVVRSYFEYKGYQVRFAQNITDVDDKIILKAKQELPNMDIQEAVKEISAKYTERYVQALNELGIPRATDTPRATEHIAQMQEYIAVLLQKGFAYESEGDVYFAVHQAPDYGRLSHQDLKQLYQAVRIERDDKKKDALDFALWKRAKADEPFWDSPWGRGRPGWHIECSVMSTLYLGNEFDIHAGGQDLIFPHHENEIAQSRGYSGSKFARVWMHNGLLTINGQKMAKSLGNFVSIADFIHKHKSHPDALKLFFLQTHYSQPIDFTWERIDQKQQALRSITDFLERVKQSEHGKKPPSSPNLTSLSPAEFQEKLKAARKNFEQFMDDDFNTPNAVAVLFEMVSSGNKVLYSKEFSRAHLTPLKKAKELIRELAGILGLSLVQPEALRLTEEQQSLVQKRQELRTKKLFKEADLIRQQLARQGIILEDNQEDTAWRRTTLKKED